MEKLTPFEKLQLEYLGLPMVVTTLEFNDYVGYHTCHHFHPAMDSEDINLCFLEWEIDINDRWTGNQYEDIVLKPRQLAS